MGVADDAVRTSSHRQRVDGKELFVNPKVLGILNVTPDSFSDGGRYSSVDDAIKRALEMVDEGADAIDLGGESTRPGSREISVQEELDRVMPVLEAISTSIEVPISIDTRRAAVAREASKYGIHFINDTSALQDDPELAGVISRTGLHVILMHRKGIPETMQSDPRYDDVLDEVSRFLSDRIEFAEAAGIERSRILVDPGLGFGKRVSDNFEITRGIARIRSLGVPVLLGASRKSFTGIFDGAPPEDRLPASLAFVCHARQSEVEWVRVHDVQETVTFLKALFTIEEPNLVEEVVN